jgi:hypothetical protein
MKAVEADAAEGGAEGESAAKKDDDDAS